jgi:hypothetical protein
MKLSSNKIDQQKGNKQQKLTLKHSSKKLPVPSVNSFFKSTKIDESKSENIAININESTSIITQQQLINKQSILDNVNKSKVLHPFFNKDKKIKEDVKIKKSKEDNKINSIDLSKKNFI